MPATTLAESRHVKYSYDDRRVVIKTGAFQEFVNNDGVVEDYSPSMFSIAQVSSPAVPDGPPRGLLEFRGQGVR